MDDRGGVWTEMGAQGSSFKTGSSSTGSSIHGMTSSWTASGGTSSSGGGNSSSSGTPSLPAPPSKTATTNHIRATLITTTTGGAQTITGGDSDGSMGAAGAVGAGVRAPEGEVAIVFTDITRAASLWDSNAMAMRDATLLHNETLRAVLKKHGGYEVVFLRDRNSGEGSFCMAFQTAADAVAWCCDVQKALLAVDWPGALLEHPGAAEEWGDTDDRYPQIPRHIPCMLRHVLTSFGDDCRVLFKGLRVRMGIHVGTPKTVRDPMTRRVEYIGPVVNAAARITAMTHGGQILMSHAAHRMLTRGNGSAEAPASPVDKKNILKLGTFEMPDAPNGTALHRS